MKKISISIVLLFFVFLSCKKDKSNDENKSGQAEANQEVNVYTHRHYDADKELFAKFEKENGIKVNVVNAKADELIQKMSIEGEQSPADVLITVDAGRLVRAKEKNLLQPVTSEFLDKTVPAHLKDAANNWFGLTKRARVIVYNDAKVKPEELSTYEALTDNKWNKRILIRSSGNIYNQSLLASIIANDGEAKAVGMDSGDCK